MRIAAIHLPELRVEVLRASSTSERSDTRSASTLVGRPVAIVVAPPPLTEQKLLGNTRIDVVSREAYRLGVREGSTIAQARARASDLAVRVVRPDAVRDVLARLAEIALAFGATVSFAMDEPSPDSFGDVVWVDVTGCAHLHGPTQAEGESTMASRLVHVMSTLGHRCSVAIAEGPRISAMLARAISRSGTTDAAFVVPPGENAQAVAPLPVAALPIGKDDARWLAKVGVATIAEMRALPRPALAKRLGERAGLLLGLAAGDDRAPLTPHVPPEIPEESVTLEYGVEGQEALLFVTKTLTDRLAARLAGRAVATTRLELRLGLDAAMTEEPRASITMELPAPLSSAPDLLAALKPKIERLVLAAPVISAKLAAPILVRKPQAALSLFEPEPKADRALPRLVAELSADLGEEAVGKLALGDAWIPEERSRFERLSAQHELPLRTKKRRHLVSSVPEPNRFLAEPVAVPRKDLEIVRHLVRLERVDWWRALPGQARQQAADFVMAMLDDGMALVEIDRTSGAARVRGWFD